MKTIARKKLGDRARFFVHHFPAVSKRFSSSASGDARTLALGADLLCARGYGEIIGGGERARDWGVSGKTIESTQPADAKRFWDCYLDDFFVFFAPFSSRFPAGWLGSECVIRTLHFLDLRIGTRGP
jgi:aspartyl/asparaginyl-tRNA synthetase